MIYHPPVMSIKPRYAVPLFCVLVCAGLAGNAFPVSILNAHFIFGSLFAMLALQVFGWIPGLAAGAVISAYTWLAWNHPWAMVTMTAEVAVAGWLFTRRRWSLVTADTVYWLCVGLPLGFVCFRFISGLPMGNALFLLAKQTINGIANALIARLVITGWIVIRRTNGRIAFRELLSNLMLVFVLGPFLVFLALAGRADMAETDRRIRDTLTWDSRQLTDGLETWLHQRERVVATLATLAQTLDTEAIQARLDQAWQSDTGFLRIALMNRYSTVTAAAPRIEDGRSVLGMNYADRPYIAEIRKTLKPIFSDVLLSKFRPEDPIVIVAAPVAAGGEYNGLVTGLIKFDRIRTLLELHATGPDVRYTLVDKKGRVILSNRPDLPSLAPFSRPGGRLSALDNGLRQWIPDLPPNTSTIDLWGKSFYVARSALGRTAQWQLILEQPVAPFQKILYRRYMNAFLLAFTLLVAALVFAELISRRVVRPIDRIVEATRTVPARVEAGEPVQWPRHPVVEADFLITNLKVMSDSLKNKFIENRQINESLEQRVAERTEALHQSEVFLESVIDNIPAMVFVKDAATLRYVKLNRAGEKLLGLSRQEMTGKNDYDFFPNAVADRLAQTDRQALAEGRLVEITEETIQTRHLGERILYTRKIPIFDRYKTPRYLLGISEDISERKQGREALEAANRKLRQSQAATLNILEDLKAENEARRKNAAERDRLQEQLIQAQKMESVGRLAGGVAHDFNNMLNVILGYTELALQKMNKDDPLYDDLTEILSAARRSADITGQLLAFARRQTIAPRTIDLNDTVEGMLKMLRRLIGEDIDLAWKPGTGLWPVNMDPAQVDQVLANLLVNARDAISGVGKITIETENARLDESYCADRPGFVPGEFVLLAVSDDGCGMDRKTMDHLFEPFFTTKEVGKGTGLGLATVYGIVRQNNGFINVYSEPGQGATFKIYLPRHAGDAVSEPLFTGTETLHGTGESVLVVEDEPSVLKLADKMLAGLGYTVMTAQGPAAALEQAKRHTGGIDLLITDVVMPEMSGRDLAEKLESMHPGLRVLYMSGYTANVIAHRGILDKGVHFIQKPFNKRDLAKKVKAVLGG